ncbi:MAG TPA: twin-arginine translocation signal domain-containing protein [Bryocella sp.]|nr:twin-arginine translocation signal domain-containing protein [Bryocella sp.]
MSDSLSRRAFLQTTAALTTAAAIAPALALPTHAQPVEVSYPENGTLIPDEGWHLWIDDKAEWQNDDIFLPEDISWINGKLCAKGQPLPVNAPTGGWSALTQTTGLEVTLPTSVEQHFWGKYGAGADGKPRPYTPEEYRYAATDPPKPPADDDIPQNGAYFGVSWWHRRLNIPAEHRGKRIFLHIRGAHLRAEVYLNHKLVGYSIMEELPFECDCTHAANPGGLNHLAIRITNPFGRFDWVDGLNAKWGKVSLYRSHGFGALDRGITISAHPKNLRVKDVRVLNTPNPKKIVVRAEFDGASPDGALIDSLKLQIVDPISGKTLDTDDVNMNPGNSTCCDREVDPKTGKPETEPTIDGEFPMVWEPADLWAVERSRLYHLRLTIRSKDGHTDTRTIAFGFRSFTVDGIDPNNPNSNAIFRLNGKRTKIYTAISWGYWGLNGMFPVPELAEKEVRAAQALGLNCLNFHRNLAKEDVLRWHDRLGVLRYMEPGAGKMAIGKLPPKTASNAAGTVMEKPTSEADKFAQRYMFTKCVEMVKAFRSHPSVFEYALQNELGADLKNPATLAVLKAMHDEDPSRCVVLNDGFVARGAAQAWYEPWDENLKEGKLHRSDEEKWGDWWNNHQGAGDQWYDEFYKSPTDYTYNINLRNVLTEYGEMEGCARPDIHGLMVHQITETYKKYGGAAPHGASYDLTDHNEIIAGYNRFLDKWGFRKSFPTPDHVFRAVGRTCYESWQNYMENARINDALDFAAISGWESTAIENHSGIVDNLRNHKSDPHLIADTLQPVRPIAKQRALVIRMDDSAVFDLYLANDTGVPVKGTLTFSMVTPHGKRVALATLPTPAEQTPEKFCYLLKEAFSTQPLNEEGLYRFRFSLSSDPLATQTKEIWVSSAVETAYIPESQSSAPYILKCVRTMGRIGLSGLSASLRKAVETANPYCFSVTDFKPGDHYDLIISSGITSHTRADSQVGESTGLEAAPPVSAAKLKPGHTFEPGEEAQIIALGHLQTGILDAVCAGTPLLAIPQTDTLSEGVAKELAAAGAFTYHGAVGDFRAPWMGNWYFVREHALFDGLPQNCALGGFYQCKGRPSNGLLVDQSPNGAPVEVIVGYSRDHDRNVGAGTFTTRLGKGKLLFHRCPDFHPVLQQRFLANALRWLTA